MNEQEIKYQKAKERVEALKGFYIHLTVYVVVNLILFSRDIIESCGLPDGRRRRILGVP